MGWMGKVWQGAAHAVLGPLLTAGAAPLQAGPRWLIMVRPMHCTATPCSIPYPSLTPTCVTASLQCNLSSLPSPCSVTSLQQCFLRCNLPAAPPLRSVSAPRHSDGRWPRREGAELEAGRGAEVAAQGGGTAGRWQCRAMAAQGRRCCRAMALQADGTAGLRHCGQMAALPSGQEVPPTLHVRSQQH